MNWNEILTNTSYADETDCIVRAFESANITTLLQLQNSVGKLGHICQVDIYALVAEINQVFSEGLPVETEVSAEAEVSEVEPEEHNDGEEE